MWWDKTSENGSKAVTFLSSSVWAPEILLLTPVGAVETISKDLMSVQFISDGIASYDGTNVFYVACSLSIKYYPFDKQSYFLGLRTYATFSKHQRQEKQTFLQTESGIL